jgi:MFS family permease
MHASDEPEYRKKEKTVNKIYLDTIYAAAKDGFSSNFIIPYALMLGAGNSFIAIISSMPQLIGSFLQLFSSDLLNIMKSRKKVIIASALLDAILYIPILLIPFLWDNNYILLLNFLILQAMATSILNPFFSSLLGDVMPEEKRGIISSRMNQISGIVSFFSSLLGGFILASFKSVSPLFGFSVIFFLAFSVRMVSAIIKSKFYEPALIIDEKGESLFTFGKNIGRTNYGKFVMYSSLIKLAVGISGPFFTVYMLNVLKMDFLTFSLINGASIISSIVVLNLLGHNIDKNGSRWMMGITGFLITLIPILWIIFKSPLALFIVELFAGAVWAGYNLSASNFVLDATTPKNRLVLTSYYNFFIGVMTFLGSLFGGYLISQLPETFFGSIFLFIFGVSAGLRLLFSLIFIPMIKEERFVDVEVKGPKSKTIITVLPKQGAVFEYLPRRKD